MEPRWAPGLVLALFAALPAPLKGQPPPLRNPQARVRVVVVQDAAVLQSFRPVPERVQALVDRGLTNFTHQPTVATAWRSLVTPQDTVGLKVLSTPGPHNGTRPEVVAAVVKGLLAAGVPPRQVIIWDKYYGDLKLAGYVDLAAALGVRVAASTQGGYDETAFYDKPFLGHLVYGDHEFGRKDEGVGKRSFVARLVSRDLTKIINITPLLNHNQAGVSGHLYSLALGSVDNTLRFEAHRQRLAEAIPEMYALPQLSDRVVLNITDALICQYLGEQRGLLHYSSVLNQLRFSRDPVALDVLSCEELNRQRALFKMPAEKINPELFFNATLLELGMSDLNKIQVEILP